MSSQLLAARPSVTQQGARQALAGAEAQALAFGVGMSVAVVDAAGHLLVFTRDDEALLVTIDAAIAKARTAAQAQVVTKVLQAFVDTQCPSLIAVRALMPASGGVPVLHQGRVIGGVGASGGSLEQDHAVAQAGADALAQLLPA
ncbi:heme-binding protein [Novosphingobium sp. 9U]|uniref:GlcG/HbpS family heme-binding protein n=1 Tax=Novosphingobium sp. 9U TaxID=2653158 RepID=UPI00135AADF5|nr:heme-binding protein [Novosphingobium sp. 9U]